MNTRIKQMQIKTRQWVWFIVLWCTGLLSAFVIALPIKLLIKLATAHS